MVSRGPRGGGGGIIIIIDIIFIIIIIVCCGDDTTQDSRGVIGEATHHLPLGEVEAEGGAAGGEAEVAVEALR